MTYWAGLALSTTRKAVRRRQRRGRALWAALSTGERCRYSLTNDCRCVCVFFCVCAHYMCCVCCHPVFYSGCQRNFVFGSFSARVGVYQPAELCVSSTLEFFLFYFASDLTFCRQKNKPKNNKKQNERCTSSQYDIRQQSLWQAAQKANFSVPFLYLQDTSPSLPPLPFTIRYGRAWQLLTAVSSENWSICCCCWWGSSREFPQKDVAWCARYMHTWM